MSAQLAGAAAGQQEQRTALRLRWPHRETRQRRMADIAGRRAAEFSHHLGLERQNRQHFVEQRPEFGGALRPPSPDAGGDVEQHRHPQSRPPNTLRHGFYEDLGVDEHDNVWALTDDGVRGLPDAPQQQRQPPQHVAPPHHRKVVHRKKAGQPLPRELRSANPEQCEVGATPEPLDQIRADAIARRLAGEDEQAQGLSHRFEDRGLRCRAARRR